MTKKELRKISLQFRTLSSQMLKIDSEEEKGCIASFYNFITETPFIHNYLIECHKQDYNFEDCFEQHGFGRKIILPSDQEGDQLGISIVKIHMRWEKGTVYIRYALYVKS